MNHAQMIQAQNAEIAMLRRQNAVLAAERTNRSLNEKILCAALTGAVAKASTPAEAAQIALESAQALIDKLRPQEDHGDPEMNQRP